MLSREGTRTGSRGPTVASRKWNWQPLESTVPHVGTTAHTCICLETEYIMYLYLLTVWAHLVVLSQWQPNCQKLQQCTLSSSTIIILTAAKWGACKNICHEFIKNMTRPSPWDCKFPLISCSQFFSTRIYIIIGGMIIGQCCISARGTQQDILGHIWGTSGFAGFFFVQNYPPALQKPFLKIQRVPPLDVLKKNSSNQVFIKAMLWHLFSRFQNGITLVYCKYFL